MTKKELLSDIEDILSDCIQDFNQVWDSYESATHGKEEYAKKILELFDLKIKRQAFKINILERQIKNVKEENEIQFGIKEE